MKTQEFDASKYLDSDEMIAEYLKAAIEEGDTKYFLEALGDVVKAKGMSRIAQETKLGRESLYKTVSGKTLPRMETVSKILAAVGVGFDIKTLSSR